MELLDRLLAGGNRRLGSSRDRRVLRGDRANAGHEGGVPALGSLPGIPAGIWMIRPREPAVAAILSQRGPLRSVARM
jgi:hypothetical protein